MTCASSVPCREGDRCTSCEIADLRACLAAAAAEIERLREKTEAAEASEIILADHLGSARIEVERLRTERDEFRNGAAAQFARAFVAEAERDRLRAEGQALDARNFHLTERLAAAEGQREALRAERDRLSALLREWREADRAISDCGALAQRADAPMWRRYHAAEVALRGCNRIDHAYKCPVGRAEKK